MAKHQVQNHSDDDSFDEDPSDEDIERLDHESAYCPDCGAEIWDSAEICPKCYAYLGGNTGHRKPIPRWVHRASIALVVFLLLLAMLWIWLRSWPAGY